MKNKTHEEFIKNVVKKYEDPEMNGKDDLIIHGIIGVVTALGEFLDAGNDVIKQQEELGDVLHFLFKTSDALDLDLENYNINTSISKMKMHPFTSALIDACELLSHVKADIFYKKSFDYEKLKPILVSLYLALLKVINQTGTTEEKLFSYIFK